MKRRSFLLAALAFAPLGGCKWIEDHTNKGGGGGDAARTAGGPLPKVQPDQLVTYLNERAARLQTLNYGDVRLVASDHSVPLPALRGSLAASQPRNFRMTGTGAAMGAKVDLGSNTDQFWVFVDAPTVKPTFVFASHTDFEAGKAKIPGGIPFEPDWVMQALGMTTLPPTNQYTAPDPDQKARTFTLRWPSVTPSGTSVVKEIVFDGDPATGNKPQVKKHIIRDTRGKLICSAEVKQAKTVQLAQTDPRTGLPLAVQHPTLLVLRWEEQKFEMELELKTGEVNKPLSEEQARRLFARPSVPGVTAVDLARYEFPQK
jgi:hypothetical protein